MSYRPITDVWILARSKVKYFGAYPAGFLSRARDLLCVGENDQVLHVCGGRVRDYPLRGFGRCDITMDLDPAMKPDLLRDAGVAESYRDAIEQHSQIQAVLADPPYSKEFAAEYKPGAKFFVSADAIVRYSLSILPIGARVGVLSLHWPRYPKAIARQVALVAVYVGNGNPRPHVRGVRKDRMKIDRILTEFVIFARERGGDDDPSIREVIQGAERHLEALHYSRRRYARLSRKPACERCEGPSSSGILCWSCLSAAPAAIRHAFRDASGLEGIRLATDKIRTWIKTDAGAAMLRSRSTDECDEPRRHAA